MHGCAPARRRSGAISPAPRPGMLCSEHPWTPRRACSAGLSSGPRAARELKNPAASCEDSSIPKEIKITYSRSLMRSLWDSPGRTNVALVKRCQAQTTRAAKPWALRPSLMAEEKQKHLLTLNVTLSTSTGSAQALSKGRPRPTMKPHTKFSPSPRGRGRGEVLRALLRH